MIWKIVACLALCAFPHKVYAQNAVLIFKSSIVLGGQQLKQLQARVVSVVNGNSPAPVPISATESPREAGASLPYAFWIYKNDAPKGWFITANTTWTVCASECQYSNPLEAWNAALSANFLNNAILTISISDGTYSIADQFYTNSTKTQYVHVVGNTAVPANVILNFTNVKGTNTGGFIADNGGIIGLIDGVTINAVGAQSAHTGNSTSWYKDSYGSGISAEHNAAITLGKNIVVNSFYYSVIADDGGVVNARGGGVVGTDAGDVNFMARGNGTIVCTPCKAIRAVDMTEPSTAILGGCFDAERGGSLYIDGSTCASPNVAAVTALSNGKAWAHNVTISAPLRAEASNGLWATEGGIIEAQNSNITGMNSGIDAQNGGIIECNYCTISNSYGSGVVADGGMVLGARLISKGSRTGYGFVALHQGNMKLSGVASSTTDNNSGSFSVETAGSGNGGSYVASTIAIAN